MYATGPVRWRVIHWREPIGSIAVPLERPRKCLPRSNDDRISSAASQRTPPDLADRTVLRPKDPAVTNGERLRGWTPCHEGTRRQRTVFGHGHDRTCIGVSFNPIQ